MLSFSTEPALMDPSFQNNHEDNYSFLEGNITGWDNESVLLFPTSGTIVPHPDVPLPYTVLLSIAIYLTIVGILSTFGNILFILTVMRWRYLRNNSHMHLLLNMAVADLAISITGYPYTTVSGYVGKWVFRSVMCQLYAFLCFTFSQVSMNTLVAVSIFRYIAICHPHKKHLLTSRQSLWALLIVWCHALFWTTSPLLGWSSYTFEPTRISCSFDWNDRTFGGITYVMGTTTFCYLSHIGILVWCYKRIFQMVARLQSKSKLRNIRWRKLRGNNASATVTTFTSTHSGQSVDDQQQKPDKQIGSPSTEVEVDDLSSDSPLGMPRCQSLISFSFVTENLTQMELHVLGMNVAMVVAFVVFWTPYAIISVVSAFYDKLSPFWYIFPTIFAKTSCMINPILYGFTNSFLRKQLMLVLRGFLGLTTAIEDFEVMRQREQDCLYNKEGIYVGKRTGLCPCEECLSSRRQARRLSEHHHLLQREKAAIPSKQQDSSADNQLDERISPILFATIEGGGDNDGKGENKQRGNNERTSSSGYKYGHHQDDSSIIKIETVKIEKPPHLVHALPITKRNDNELQPQQPSLVKVIASQNKHKAIILNVAMLPIPVPKVSHPHSEPQLGREEKANK